MLVGRSYSISIFFTSSKITLKQAKSDLSSCLYSKIFILKYHNKDSNVSNSSGHPLCVYIRRLAHGQDSTLHGKLLTHITIELNIMCVLIKCNKDVVRRIFVNTPHIKCTGVNKALRI